MDDKKILDKIEDIESDIEDIKTVLETINFLQESNKDFDLDDVKLYDEDNSEDEIPEVIEPSEEQPIGLFIDESDIPDKYYTSILERYIKDQLDDTELDVEDIDEILAESYDETELESPVEKSKDLLDAVDETLCEGTEGFMSVLDRLEGVSRDDDFTRIDKVDEEVEDHIIDHLSETTDKDRSFYEGSIKDTKDDISKSYNDPFEDIAKVFDCDKEFVQNMAEVAFGDNNKGKKDSSEESSKEKTDVAERLGVSNNVVRNMAEEIGSTENYSEEDEKDEQYNEKEPSFQKFFGMSEDEYEAFKEASETAASGYKIEDNKDLSTDSDVISDNSRITEDDDIVGLTAENVMGVSQDNTDKIYNEGYKLINKYNYNRYEVEQLKHKKYILYNKYGDQFEEKTIHETEENFEEISDRLYDLDRDIWEDIRDLISVFDIVP